MKKIEKSNPLPRSSRSSLTLSPFFFLLSTRLIDHKKTASTDVMIPRTHAQRERQYMK
jgi:hypothetical protein